MGISTDTEKAELQKLDSLKTKEIIEFFEESEKETEDKIQKLEQSMTGMMSSFEKYHRATLGHSKFLIESFGGFSEAMVNKIGELGGTLSTSYEKNKPINAAGVYKDMINQLSAINKSVKEKPVPVWNWPQYAGVSVRDKNFSNINPSIAPFNITAAYNEIGLSNYTGSNVGTVTYLQDGIVVAVLSLSYDGSGNLTDVTRTQ